MFVIGLNGTFRWFCSVVAAPAARFSSQVCAAAANPTKESVNKADRISFYLLFRLHHYHYFLFGLKFLQIALCEHTPEDSQKQKTVL
jgi:hypothetical protein